MPSLTADDGVRLDYTEYGDAAGRPVVLIAGFKAPATTWRYQVPAFADAGYRVLAVDLRGHGTSEHPEHGVDMARRGRDVTAALAADGTAVVLDDDGHAANMEQPKAFNRAVLEWLGGR